MLSWREVFRISPRCPVFQRVSPRHRGRGCCQAWYAARAAPHRRAEAAVSVFVDRVLGTLGLLLAALILAAPNLGIIATYRRYQAVTLIIVGMFLAAAALLVLGFYTGSAGPWRALRAVASSDPQGRIRSPGAVRMPAVRTGPGIPSADGVLVPVDRRRSRPGLCGPRRWDRTPPRSASPGVHLPGVVCVSALPVTPSGLGFGRTCSFGCWRCRSSVPSPVWRCPCRSWAIR